MTGYYSVYNPRGEKIADCGIERDALNLISMRNRRWDGHYYTFIPVAQLIDLEPFPQNQLPSVRIAGQEIAIQQQLPPNCQEPFITKFHD